MIDILLSTYNGEAFLREQIDSILAQTDTNWRLLIRDDGSTDSTVEIIESYCSRHSEKMTFILDDEKSNLGPCQSFHRLMEKSSADYVMFCDQDDVWRSDKIKVMMSVMNRAEQEGSPEIPILLHSDLEVVNAGLKLISNSFIQHNRLDPKNTDLIRLSIRNNVTGCAMLCNRSLIDLALPIPNEAIMHDWWLALVASAFGKINFIPQVLVRYRQHSGNHYGAGIWKNTFKKYWNPKRYRRNLADISRQIHAFKAVYDKKISDDTQREFMENFGDLRTASFWRKRKVILKYGHRCQSIQKTLVMSLLA